jgi:hypothetical protein
MKRVFPALLGLSVGVLACYGILQFTSGRAVAQAPPLPEISHFKCYTIMKGQLLKYDPPLVLQDRLQEPFHEEHVSQARSKYICTPVSKNGSPIFQPDLQLQMYAITGSAFPKNQRPHMVLKSLNPHFPDEEIDVVKPAFLLVPALKAPPPPPPDCLIICG